MRGRGIAFLASRTNLTRDPLSHIFLHGDGIEIGSLNWPLDVPKDARVTYVDAWPTEVLAARHPEFAKTLLPVGIVSPIETLAAVPDASQDFVIANHVLEHTENPVAALRNILRTLRPGGILFLTLPDKRFTFDVDRPVTPFEHLLKDEAEGPEGSRAGHYREFGELVNGLRGEELERYVARNETPSDDIHFHVWTQTDMLEMLVRLRKEHGFPLELEAMSKTGIEAIFVLRKG
jgi:SAM-dependent methyltransferase